MKTLDCNPPRVPRRGTKAQLDREPILGQQLHVPVWIEAAEAGRGEQPVTLGVPFAAGILKDPEQLALFDHEEVMVPSQRRSLAWWPDGSVKWLLLDFLLTATPNCPWSLRTSHTSDHQPESTEALSVSESESEFQIDTGVATVHLDKRTFRPFRRVVVQGRDVLEPNTACCTLTVASGHQAHPEIEDVRIETRGPVRLDVACSGVIPGRAKCRFVGRLSFFARSTLVQLRFTIHNPRRAWHPRGLWDLGDAGSVFFRELSLSLQVHGPDAARVAWSTEPGQPVQYSSSGKLEVYQDSSGGENWQSRNHVNRQGHVLSRFRGYRVRSAGVEAAGLRATPVVSIANSAGSVTAAVSEFWQNFPKAIETGAGQLHVRLFPRQFDDVFELQGGEQKTHTVWLRFDEPRRAPLEQLDWIRCPACAHLPPSWYAESKAIPHLVPADRRRPAPLDRLLEEACDAPGGLPGRREPTDEYGWRNYGEIYADHEREHYAGSDPFVSHYNNQYDSIHGSILQFLRTGQADWWAFLDPLARHVIDIDIYHTQQDRAAYNGGLFWFTDHYQTAATSTHRTYSRANVPKDRSSYGGGPGSEHNFTRGLLHYYYLTGDPQASEAVLELAHWVIAMDDGRRTILSLLDDGPTGLATATGSLDYQGPGRAAGNSISALLDVWQLTGVRSYLLKAEEFIQRCIHPQDDVASRDLLNAEKRWSYTVFLTVLDRYLRLKAEADEIDANYAYAQASLLHYAEWMLHHERPYFDRREELEFPTEAWPGQELRKANVLRLAAAHAEEPLRTQLHRRGTELAERAWGDLFSFSSRTSARALALMMTEGTVDHAVADGVIEPAIRAETLAEWPLPVNFIPQRTRVQRMLKTPLGLVRAITRILNPCRWWEYGTLSTNPVTSQPGSPC
jgi:hypothetical protein